MDAPPSAVVQGPGDDLLADPGLALDQDIQPSVGQLGDGGPEAGHGLAGAQQGQFQPRVALGRRQPPVVQHQRSLLQRPVQTVQQPLEGEGLGHEIIGTVPQGLDRIGDVAMAGDHQHGQALVDRL